jgi:hypothetical protein
MAAPGGWQQGAMPAMGHMPAGPAMGHPGMPAGHVMSALEGPLAGYDAPEETGRRKKKVKKGPDITTYVAIALVVMTVILVVVLALVLMEKSSDTETPAAPPAKAHKAKAGEADGEGKDIKKTKKKPAVEEMEPEEKDKM